MSERRLVELTVTISLTDSEEFIVKVAQAGGITGARRFSDWSGAAEAAADLFKRFSSHFAEASDV